MPRFLDLEIELRCLITKINNSDCKRFAGELLSDITSCITKCEKLNKTMKKLQIDPKGIDVQGYKTLRSAMNQIETSEKSITLWAVRFGVSDEKVKRGTKRKVPLVTSFS